MAAIWTFPCSPRPCLAAFTCTLAPSGHSPILALSGPVDPSPNGDCMASPLSTPRTFPNNPLSGNGSPAQFWPCLAHPDHHLSGDCIACLWTFPRSFSSREACSLFFHRLRTGILTAQQRRAPDHRELTRLGINISYTYQCNLKRHHYPGFSPTKLNPASNTDAKSP